MQIRILTILMSFVFIVLLSTLFKIQVIDYDRYYNLSERNRIRPVLLEAPRGIIRDRNGMEVVGNRLSFDCYILPVEENKLQPIFEKLSRPLLTTSLELTKRYKKNKRGRQRAVLIATDISKRQAIQIEEMSMILDGVFVKTRPVREYWLGEAGAHILGYIGSISPNEYKKMRSLGYRRNDKVGRGGIEEQYDSYLRGQHGASQFEVDSVGRLLHILSIQERVAGEDLELTIDAELQKKIYTLLKKYVGGIGVMDLKTGGLLALVSSPSFNPDYFIHSQHHPKELKALLSNKKKPLMNRNLSGEYPPGSTFKPISTLAALRDKKIKNSTHFFCPGSFSIVGFRFNCWKKSGHGSVNVIDAMEQSCNVFFYQLGMKVGAEMIRKEAERFGLGKRTKIDLPGEKGGLLPGPKWKKRTLKEKWYTGETANYVIGQGYLLATPVQMLKATAAIATNGNIFEPHIVQSISEIDVSKKLTGKVKASQNDWGIVKKGLKAVVQSKRGTGQRAKISQLEISGKTGTAQAPRGEDHAWFIGYAPSDEPQVALVVLLEHGGKGGGAPVEIARKIFIWLQDFGYIATRDGDSI